MNKELRNTRRFIIIFITGITLLFGSSLYWNIQQEWKACKEYAMVEARASFNKDILYRRWAAMHGGVYVPVTDATPPNPNLSFIPERDITTASGKKLTLMNPAYMTRQVFALAETYHGEKAHITSLKPIFPGNKPDSWEAQALHRFEKGEAEYYSVENSDGKEYLRYMHAMRTEENCLKCHAKQGYKVGDVRGGISVSVPMEAFNKVSLANIKDLVNTHAIVYVVVLVMSILSFRRFYAELVKRNLMQERLVEHEASLQIQNKEYVALNDEYKKQNEELRLAKERAEESDCLKTAFLQNMSHEIRTPMNAIMGFADLLPQNIHNKAKLEQFSRIISQRSRDLLDIINDILDISRIESGQLPVNMVECNIWTLFGELNTFFVEYQKRLGKEHITLTFQADGISPDFIIINDKVKLKQIFINLITNAFKFTDEGRIDVGCRINDNQTLLFYVSDTGIGIPAEKQKIVFERFAQLNQNPKRNIGGTGLGLSIVEGLVHLLGGSLMLESQPGKGSTFSFTIP